MASVKRFEDLEVWKEARALVNAIYQLTKRDGFNRDFGLRDQIRRAAVSVMSNIAEGFHAGSDSEFIRFLGYARRSDAETSSQLYIALDQQYITPAQFAEINDKTEKIIRQCNALIGYLDKSRRGVREESSPYHIDDFDE